MDKDIKSNFEKLKIDIEHLLIRRIKDCDKVDNFEIFSDEQTAINDGCRPCSKIDKNYETHFKDLVSDEMHYAIELKQCHKMIGILHLTKVSERAVKCYEIGYDIYCSFRRKGYATEAIKAIIKYCFNILSIEMITATVYDWNKESANLLNKLGFIQEGKIHKAEKHYKYGIVDVLSFYKEK